MNKDREELLEKLFKEMIYAFRSLKPEHHDHDHKEGFSHRFAHKFRHRLGGWGEHKFGRGHMDLFFRLTKEKEGVSVKDIASSLNITSGAVTQMVDKAVKIGIVTREEDPNDRRSQRIKLSEKAKDKVEGIRVKFLERVGPKFSNLTDKEVLQLTELLRKVNSSIEEKS